MFGIGNTLPFACLRLLCVSLRVANVLACFGEGHAQEPPSEEREEQEKDGGGG